jgi:putative urate catabolism protein
MTDGYPRDMVGYGEHTPDPKWPGGARLAVSFVLNYEEGAEMSVLHGDAASEAYLQEIVGLAPRSNARDLNVESMYEYGSRAGFWRVRRIFMERGLPLTVYAAGMALERAPDAGPAMLDAGWEVASHGYRWFDYSAVSEEQERADLARTVEVHRRLLGERPLGWYCGRRSERTRRLVVEEGGFLYDNDSYADDLPYWEVVAGKPLLIVPYTLDTNDFKFALYNGFSHGEEFYQYCRDAFDVLHAEGADRPKMLSIGLHCRLAGRPGRAKALARLLDYVSGQDKVWVCRRVEIARHWQAVHPYRGG